MSALQRSFRELLRYPSAIVGLIIIVGLLILSAYTLITIPYRRGLVPEPQERRADLVQLFHPSQALGEHLSEQQGGPGQDNQPGLAGQQSDYHFVPY